jgi:hypothetical protein
MSIESDIAAITDGTPETIASIRMIYKAAADRAYENLRLLDDAILNHIEANGGNPVPSGATTELRATYPHETKLRKGAKVAVLKHLFDICLGDFGTVAEHLTSQPYKPAACKSLIEVDDWVRYFEVIHTAKVVEGKRKPVLTEVDKRFITTGAEQ